MRVLGVDWGSVRVGLAISDELLLNARPLDVLPPRKFFAELPRIIKDQSVERIVVGLPKTLAGELGESAAQATKFAEKIKSVTGLPVELIDERLSSKFALDGGADETSLDASAAAVFLQTYLDQQKNN